MRPSFAILAFSVNLALGIAHAEGKVEGTLTFNGKTIPLTHVCVFLHTNEEELLDNDELRILLTDKEVKSELLARPVLSRLDAMAREGAVQGVLLRYDPSADDREVNGTIYAKLDDPQMSMPFFTLSGGDAGFVSMDYTPQNMTAEIEYNSGESSFEDMPTYSYKASYTAPVQSPPALTATLEGKEALDSPQAQAAINFEKAMRDGKLDVAKSLCTPARAKDLETFVNQVGEEEFKKQAKMYMPDPAERAKHPIKIYVRDTTGVVIFEEEGGSSSVNVIKAGDAWKLD